MNATQAPQNTSRSFLARAFALLCASALVLGSTACRSGGSAPNAVSGGTYYTAFGVRVDQNKVRSTNYRTENALLLPINTEVEFVSQRRHRFTMRLPAGQTFLFEHIAKHTKDSAGDAFDSFFSATPIDLSGFSPSDQAAIQEARVEVGMSKDAVLAAIGPPPASGTLTRDGDVWKYWSTRWSTFNVRFDDEGRVSAIGE